MTDDQLALTFIQGQLLRRLQLDPARVLGRTLPDLLMDGREDHPLIQAHHAALAGHETPVRIEWGGRLYDARVAPLRDAYGRVDGCVGVHQEIGWLPDDEGTMRESDMRLQRVADSSLMGIAYGREDGVITDANEAFLALSGYTRADLAADRVSWPALCPVESHQRQLDAMQEVRTTGRCAPFESDLIRKDGRHVPILVSGARLSARRREGVAFVLDLSERNQMRDRFAAEIACADALLDAAGSTEAVHRAMRAIREGFACQAVSLWLAPRTGRDSRIVARDGAPSLRDDVLGAMAAESVEKGETLWSPAARTLFVPLTAAGADDARGALVVVMPPGVVPCPVQLDGLRSIALRLSRYLQRQPID
jgi:PAS domain S-box-containing protein